MDSEVAAVLEQYEELKEFGGEADVKYSPPTAYPTSALLGCIDVVDCVAGEDLRAEGVHACVPKTFFGSHICVCAFVDLRNACCSLRDGFAIRC